ncbi:MAG: FtsX-like permease family protein [Acidobacteriaceae bacterium]
MRTSSASCALLLARANAREKEMAVRLAIGPGKARLMRQSMAESILLGVSGGALGVALAFWGSRSLLALMARGRSPVSLSVLPDPTVLAFALVVSLPTALVFGAIPAWRAADVDPSLGLAQKTHSSAGTGQRHRLGKSLLILQVAVSLVLLVAAGLLTRTLTNLSDFYPGINRDNVLLFSIDPGTIGYQQVTPLYEQLLSRIAAIPGVRLASLSVHEPLSISVSDTGVKIQGPVPHEGEDLTPVDVEMAGPNYLATMQTPLLRGREFSAADRAGSPEVAILNESMARHFFGNADPIGRRVSIPGYRRRAGHHRSHGPARNFAARRLRPCPWHSRGPLRIAPRCQPALWIKTRRSPHVPDRLRRHGRSHHGSQLPARTPRRIRRSHARTAQRMNHSPQQKCPRRSNQASVPGMSMREELRCDLANYGSSPGPHRISRKPEQGGDGPGK